jgi:F-type H+-transporting ATPase subunit b
MMRLLSISDAIEKLEIGDRIFPSIQDVLTQLLATLVIVFLLAKFLWKPAKKYIDARKNYVASSIEDAEKKNEEAGKLLAIAQEKLDKSDDEAVEIIKNAKKEAHIEADKIIESANKTAKDRIEQANIEIERARRESLEEIRKEIIDVAMMAAEKVVEREIDTKDNKKFLDKFVKDVVNE